MTALFDENGYPIKEAFEQKRIDDCMEYRRLFREVHAPEIKQHGADFWKFPYTEASPALLEYAQSSFGFAFIDDDLLAQADMSREEWDAFIEAWKRVPEHFAKVLETMKADEHGIIDFTPIAQALAREGYGKRQIFGNILFEEGDEITESSTFGLSEDVISIDQKECIVTFEPGYSLSFSDTRIVEDNEYMPVSVMVPYTDGGEFIHYPFMYLTLYALVSLMDEGEFVRTALKLPKAEKPAKAKRQARKISKEDFEIQIGGEGRLPELIRVPNTAEGNFINTCLTYARTGRVPSVLHSKNSDVSVKKDDKGTVTITISDGSGDMTATMRNFNGIVRDKNANINKIFRYVLHEIYSQNFSRPVVFPLQNLVDLGIYKTVDSARMNLPKALMKISDASIEVSGRRGRKKKTDGMRIVTEFSVTSTTVSVYPTDLEWAQKALSEYTAWVPRFVWGLNGNSFMLAYEIFTRARQRSNQGHVLKNEPYPMTVKYIVDVLGLPTVEECSTRFNRKYREKIQDPIDRAIADIREAASKASGESGNLLTISMEGMIEAADINDYIANGRINITLKGEWAEHYKEVGKMTAKHAREYEKERNRQKARKSLKAAKNG